MLPVVQIHPAPYLATPILDPIDANSVLHPFPKPMLQKKDSAKPISNSRSANLTPKAILNILDPLTSMV